MNNIHPNLVFLTSYLEDSIFQEVTVLSKTWSAEMRVHYTSRAEELSNLDIFQNKELFISTNPEIFKELSSKERVFLYEVFRAISIKNSEIRWLVDDLEQLYNKRGMLNNERYLYLTSLSDAEFAYELDTKLLPKQESRRFYYRMLRTTFGKKGLSLFEIFKKFIFVDWIELNKKFAKKAIRHKGYRDHGSLRSEFSKTREQQGRDWSFRQKEEQKRKEKNDFLSFLLGYEVKRF